MCDEYCHYSLPFVHGHWPPHARVCIYIYYIYIYIYIYIYTGTSIKIDDPMQYLLVHKEPSPV